VKNPEFDPLGVDLESSTLTMHQSSTVCSFSSLETLSLRAVRYILRVSIIPKEVRIYLTWSWFDATVVRAKRYAVDLEQLDSPFSSIEAQSRPFQLEKNVRVVVPYSTEEETTAAPNNFCPYNHRFQTVVVWVAPTVLL
jgi:hypothetical protein